MLVEAEKPRQRSETGGRKKEREKMVKMLQIPIQLAIYGFNSLINIIPSTSLVFTLLFRLGGAKIEASDEFNRLYATSCPHNDVIFWQQLHMTQLLPQIVIGVILKPLVFPPPPPPSTSPTLKNKRQTSEAPMRCEAEPLRMSSRST